MFLLLLNCVAVGVAKIVSTFAKAMTYSIGSLKPKVALGNKVICVAAGH